MNRDDIHTQCQEAIPYYYDYLRGRREQIPETTAVHIAGCPNCQDEIHWLKTTDSKSSTNRTPQNLRAISHAAQMQLHCALIDQPVRCSTIKSFLPVLAIPEMQVRISTPVTEHIKACSQCSHDLDTLKNLNLSLEQLYCLSQIITQKQSDNAENSASVTDAFFQDGTDSMKAIRQIIDRPDSGIVTCCRKSHQSKTASNSPFTVEVENKSLGNQRASHVRITSTKSTHFRRLLRPVAAAAAIVLVTILLFQNVDVKATDIGQIYEALKTVKNLKMKRVEVETRDPVQTLWISRSLGFKLLKNNGNMTLLDVHNNIQKDKEGSSSKAMETSLDQTTVQCIAKTMDPPWGLLPFNRTSELPDGAVWKKVQTEDNDMSNESIEMYDLFWTEESMAGMVISYQWRCLLNAQIKRPLKVEWWRKTQQDQDYELMSFTEIIYLTEEQIRQAVIQAGF